MNSAPPAELRERVERACGKKSQSWVAPGFGLSAAHRFCVRFSDDSSAFVKAATDNSTEKQLRVEHLALSSLLGRHAPTVLAWLDEPEHAYPVLITEDLSFAYWPAGHDGTVWKDGQVAALFDGLRAIASIHAPETLEHLRNRVSTTWPEIASDPEPFLRLGLCSEQWFQQVIDALIVAERQVVIDGDALVHGDVRSDNLCFRGSSVVFVDWSDAARGNPDYDVAWALPTIHLEGGPQPFDVFPNGGDWATWLSGIHIKRACTDRSAPEWLTRVFKRLIAIELEWAAASLGLPNVDGPTWREF